MDLVAGLQLRMLSRKGLQNQTLDQALKDALKDVQDTLRVPRTSRGSPDGGFAASAKLCPGTTDHQGLIGAAAAAASAGPIGAAIGSSARDRFVIALVSTL